MNLRKYVLLLPIIAAAVLMWPGCAPDSAETGWVRAEDTVCSYAALSERGSCSASGLVYLTEMRDEDDKVVYESIPENEGFPNLQDEERRKQDRAWDMLNNAWVIAPGNGRRPPYPPMPESGR